MACALHVVFYNRYHTYGSPKPSSEAVSRFLDSISSAEELLSSQACHKGYISQQRPPSRFMANDRIIGGAIFGGSIVGIILYGLLVIYAWQITLRVTAFLGIALLLGILAWIGYTMATTPPPEPITEIPDVGKPAEEPTEKKEAASP